mmetsp:Transcript_44925/g.48617  ORF Transcript_44925/g.48617 Transcript_44925/m.48617 type:complete len:431 (-) Transcript_44925:291-1583(-)
MRKINNTSTTTMTLRRVIVAVIATAAVLLLTNNGNGGDGNNNFFVRGSENTATTVRRRRVLVQNVNPEVDSASVRESELDTGAELDFYDHDFRVLSSMSMDTIEMKQVYFTADTTPLGEGEVTSETTLFIPQWTGLSDVAAPNDVICFVGSAQQLEADIESVYGGGSGTQCSAANGCGVHVHAGTSCEDTDTQGGHWYNTETVSEDPWATVGYLSTTAEGYGQYASCVRTGYDLMSDPSLLEGHVFIVHGEDGGRISCGPIVPASPATNTIPIPTSAKFLTAETVPFPADDDGNGGGTGTGMVKVMSDLSQSVEDGVCYMGWATGLTPNVVSFLVDGSTSEQCNVKNGCGAHIHEGPGCASKDEQGSHYYDRETLEADPWALESYYTTDSAGTAALIGCVITGAGAADYESKAFVVHSVAGDRLLCGLLE